MIPMYLIDSGVENIWLRHKVLWKVFGGTGYFIKGKDTSPHWRLRPHVIHISAAGDEI